MKTIFRTKPIKSAMALLIIVLILIGSAPLEAIASNPQESLDIYMGLEHVYLEGVKTPVTDERVLAVTPVTMPLLRSGLPPANNSIVTISSAWAEDNLVTVTPPNRQVRSVRYFTEINGVRYEAFCIDPGIAGPQTAASNGIAYQLIEEVTGTLGQTLHNILANGFPSHPHTSAPTIAGNVQIENAYITRVAIAMAGRPGATFTGNQNTISRAQGLLAGNPISGPPQSELPPLLRVNNTTAASNLGKEVDSSAESATSDVFEVQTSRATHDQHLPYRFVWGAGTPANARLYVNGTLHATAPANNPAIVSGDSSFVIRMPNTAEFQEQTAAVELVNPNAQWANRVWRMGVPGARSTYQDIVLFIPGYGATASFSFTSDDDQFGRLRIVKTNMQNSPLAGATFNITGPDPSMPMTVTVPSSGWTSPELVAGVYTIAETSPPPGHQIGANPTQTVTIAEGQAGTVTATFQNPGTTTTQLSAGVRIQKIDALTRQNIPGALMRLRGVSNQQVVTGDGQIWEFDNTGINISQVLTSGATTAVPEDVTSTVADGVWTLGGLPFGAYIVEEERAPHNYSLLPQHTSYAFWLLPPNVVVEATGIPILCPETGDVLHIEIVYEIIEIGGINSVLITFENYPFGSIELTKLDEVTSRPIAGAVFQIEGYFAEGNPGGIPTHRTGTTDSGGRIRWDDLPAGMYAITETHTPAGYVLSDETVTVPITWGQTATVVVTNTPMSSLEVQKVDSVTGTPIGGAVFELRDPSTGETWQAATSAMGIAIFGRGSNGNELMPGRAFIITEIQSPPGYVRNHIPQEVVLSPGNNNRVTIPNTPMSSLEVQKVDGSTGAPLSGAIFELRDPSTGETWQSTTGSTGIAVFGRGPNGNEFLPGRTFILTEVQAPPGYVLHESPQEVVLTPGSSNRVTVRNYTNPSLTIIKRDRDTQAPLSGAVFSVEYENGTAISGSPFTTDALGQIVLPWTLFEGNSERTLIITETSPPSGYHLSEPNWQRATMRQGENNVITFENARMPTLTIQKQDAVTGAPVVGAWFTIEKLDHPGQGTLTGNQFATDSSGRIVVPYRHSGIYRVIETRAANNYWLDPLEINRTWTIELRGNEDFVLTVENTMLPTLVITKMNALTNRPVPLTHFRIEYEVPNSSNVTLIGNFVTGSQGQIIIPHISVGWYRVTETRPAPGMSLNINNNYRVYLGPGDNTYQMPGRISGLQANEPPVQEVTEEHGELLPARTNNEPEYTYEDLSEMTDEEIINLVSHNMLVTGGDSYRLGENVWNWPLNSIVIKKSDATTGRLLQGATFELIYVSTGESGTRGTVIGRFTTNHSGIIVITGLEPGAYVVEESAPPPNYTLSANNRQHAFLRPDGFSIVEMEFSNHPFGSLLITKRCAVSGAPLHDAEFRVTDSSGAVVVASNGLFRTSLQGEILIPNLPPDSYIITETIAPNGYEADSAPQTIRVNATGNVYRLEFVNRPLSGLLIVKRCEVTGQPLQGAEFRVTNSTGAVTGPANGLFVTNQQGEVLISNLPPDSYVVTETRAPDGFDLSSGSQTIRIDATGQIYRAEFANRPLSGLLIVKRCEATGVPLQGAEFRVTDSNGTVVGDSNGLFVTNRQGEALIPNLPPDSYVVTETKAPGGFELNSSPQTIRIDATGQIFRAEFTNRPLSGLIILKLDSVTRLPLQGAEFRVTDSHGAVVGTANGRFVTNATGQILIPGLPQGTYIVTETRAPAGYTIDGQPQTIAVDYGRMYTLEFYNTPIGGFQLLKLDEETRAPIPNVEFAISKMNGEQIGVFTTDANGIISIPNIESGWFTAVERRAASGFILDATPHNFEIRDGETTSITVTNRQSSGILLHKVDAVTGEGIYGVRFLISDANNNPFRTVVTDQNGYIFISGLPDGKYFIREIEAASGYIIDNRNKTFHVTYGSTETIIWRNTPMQGQIQITKRSADDNPINGFPAGTLLQGAVFEILDRANNVVDRVETDRHGLAVSQTLPLGRYTVREVTAPSFYAASLETFDAEIEFSGQIIRLTVLNESVFTNVSVTKRGYAEVMPGQQIRYDFRNIGNNSTVPLDSFYWRDTLPTDAVRLDRIITGTWSHRLSYKIVYKTNTSGGEQRTLSDNLDSGRNHVIDASSIALGLAANEFVTEVMFVFGRVPAGFRQVEAPQIFCMVLQGLPNEYRFANRTDVGGLWGRQWIMANDRWVTSVYSMAAPPRLPRTGF